MRGVVNSPPQTIYPWGKSHSLCQFHLPVPFHMGIVRGVVNSLRRPSTGGVSPQVCVPHMFQSNSCTVLVVH